MNRRGNSRSASRGVMAQAAALWKRLPPGVRWNLEDSFQPGDPAERLLPGEEAQLEIHLAWYRDILGWLVFDRLGWFTGLAVLISLVVAYVALLRGTALSSAGLYGLVPLGLALALATLAAKERIEHRQWRLLKTNARLIISIPQQGTWWPLVDNIELKGLPNVIDTNWSRNPVWRIFQFFTGARDLYVSLSAYKFVEGTARVGDALIMPDVMPEDVLEFKRLVFRIPHPQRVIFPSPQKVIVTEQDEG
jgi:hypothetical protein